jgi:hypothetical protein
MTCGRQALVAEGAAQRDSRRAMIIGRLGLMIVLGGLLAGCDKCGDWWSPMRGEALGETQDCRDQAPRPQ